MKVLFKKMFLKDIEVIPLEFRTSIQREVFEVFPRLTNVHEHLHIKKLAGYKSFYRMRIGNYRIGFELRTDTVVFYRVLHRKEMYKYFP